MEIPRTLEDQPARDRIAGADPADLERSFTVEAGAGSGKTTQLVGRLVAIAERAGVREESDPLGEVVAISFTRKAAAELRAQAYRGLAERSAKLAPVDDESHRRHARLRHALARLDTTCIDTIHGFCGRILRAEALAVGLPPDFQILGEKEAREDLLAFWRRYVARTPDDRLAEAGLEARDVQSLFERLSARAGRLPAPYGASAPDPAPAVAVALGALRELQALRDGKARGSRDPLQRALDRAERLLAYRGVDTPSAGAHFLEVLLEGCRPRRTDSVWQSRWPDRTRAKELQESDVPALAEAILPTVRAWQAFVYDRALAFAFDAVHAFDAERLTRGRNTQDDVLVLTARLLRESPRARRRASERYRRMLVDEFQDTDPIQAEVLFLLAADDAGAAAPATDWKQCRPRPGSLFLVGDPKQAIYRFRGADIRTYAEAREVLVASGGETLHLTTCFRTVPALCDWINGCLEAPFNQDAALPGGAGRQATYEPLLSGRIGAPSDGTVPTAARIDVPVVPEHRADEIAPLDAEAIAEFIRAAVDGRGAPALYGGGARPFDDTARYGDFLVLCRAASRFDTYAAALERYGIPYALAGDKSLGRADELRALVDLLDAIRDPLDGPVVLGVRTGLLGGFSSEDVIGIYKTGLTKEQNAAVGEWRELVADSRRALDELPLGAALDWIAQRTGLLSVSASRPDGGSRRPGSLLKVLALARDYEATGLHWTEAADRLRELMNGEATAGAITLEEGAADAVRIMTVHQAKGLQAPVVILADPYDAYDHPPREHAGRLETGEAFLTVPLTNYHGSVRAAPLRWHETDADEERLFAEAESRRVTYVAATRAEGLLVVSRYEGRDRELIGHGSWGLLHAGLDDAPALADLIAAPAVPAPAPDDATPIPDFAGRRRAALGAAATPTYASTPVTAGDDGDDDVATLGRWEPDGRRAGRGSAFGTAVHHLFQWAIRWRSADAPASVDRARLERLWRQLRVQVPEPEGVEALRALRASDLWHRLLIADEVLTEAPVAGERLTGAIDLAFRDAQGWHLVDFKTDPAPEEADVDAIVARHAAQLQAYGQLWAAAAGAAPASMAVYLTDRGACYAVA